MSFSVSFCPRSRMSWAFNFSKSASRTSHSCIRFSIRCFSRGLFASIKAFAAASEGFDASFDAEGPHLWWFVNSIGGFGLRVPDLRALGRAAREAHALLVVDNTVASIFGCDPLRLGAVLSLEALDRVFAGEAPRKLVVASVGRSQLKRHRVDAAASAAHSNTIPGVNTGTDFRTFELPAYRSTDIVDACVVEFLANAYHPCYLFLHEL